MLQSDRGPLDAEVSIGVLYKDRFDWYSTWVEELMSFPSMTGANCPLRLCDNAFPDTVHEQL